jgi:hypothetical protein
MQLFKLMFYFNSSCLLHGLNIMCSSSGRPFVHAVFYVMFFMHLCKQSIRWKDVKSMRNFSTIPSCLSTVLQKNGWLSGPIVIQWVHDKLCYELSAICKAKNVDLKNAITYNNALGQPHMMETSKHIKVTFSPPTPSQCHLPATGPRSISYI